MKFVRRATRTLLQYTARRYMQAMIADTVVRAAARRRRHQRVKLPTGSVRLNIGAGLEVADGWIHVDGSIHALAARWPVALLRGLYRQTVSVRQHMTEAEYIHRLKNHRFVFHDLGFGLPFADGSADHLFCSHVLEHFTRDDARRLAGEMYRVLKPGGRVRIAVPDMERAIGLYQAGARAEALAVFYTDGRAGSYDQHRYMYDYILMRDMLADCGFAEIRRCSFRQGDMPDLELLDNRPDESLFVEAVKPARAA